MSKPIIDTKNTEWKAFIGEELPEAAKKFAIKHDIFKGYGYWLHGCVFYKGDIETTEDWIIVTDDGGYYKVNATYMIWHGPGHAQAIWSTASLKKSLKSLVTTGKTVFDPDYQT